MNQKYLYGAFCYKNGVHCGIGKEIAKLHASQGGDLVVVARNKNRLNLLKEELEHLYHIHVIIIEKDLSLANSSKEIYDEVKAKNIEVDYLINNAGFVHRGNGKILTWTYAGSLLCDRH